VDFDAAVVVYEGQFLKIIHAETRAELDRTNHLRKLLLVDFAMRTKPVLQ
jgi:hypothetical protein